MKTQNRDLFGTRKPTTRGQAMTEYILIVSLVAIGCLMAVTSFGHQIAELFKRSTKALGTGSVQRVAEVHPEDFTPIDQGDRLH